MTWPSPCVLCGYNGPRFYESTVHPCMEHGSERNALLAEVDRLRAERDALRAKVESSKVYAPTFTYEGTPPVNIVTNTEG